MSEGLFLALAIPLAAAVLSLAAAVALYDSRAPATRSEAPVFVRARLLCPLSHELTSADVGVAQRPPRSEPSRKKMCSDTKSRFVAPGRAAWRPGRSRRRVQRD